MIVAKLVAYLYVHRYLALEILQSICKVNKKTIEETNNGKRDRQKSLPYYLAHQIGDKQIILFVLRPLLIPLHFSLQKHRRGRLDRTNSPLFIEVTLFRVYFTCFICPSQYTVVFLTCLNTQVNVQEMFCYSTNHVLVI